MLKKLKKKFVITNMCLVGAVLLIVFTIVGVNSYQQAREEVNGALSMALNKAGDEKTEPFEIGRNPGGDPVNEQPAAKLDMMAPLGNDLEGKPLNYAAVVVLVNEVDGERQITHVGMENASMDTAVMEEAVEKVMASKDEQGKLPEMELFYMKASDLYGTKTAFVDSSYFDAKIMKTVLISLVLFCLGMAAIFLISLLLANVAVAPVKKAWDQQRRFVADASHELKTPLTVLLANNEIMMLSAEEETKRWLESSQEEATHMKALIDDLLFLARADEEEETGSIKPDKAPADISDVVTGIALQFEPVVFEAGVRLETDVSKGINMKCELTQMKQLIHILLDNAVKYCSGEGNIWLKLKEKADVIELAVANTGSVMDDEDLEHIFERFYRSDKSRNGEGYGLGLSIAKTIAESHGGQIRAYSGYLDMNGNKPEHDLPEEKMTGTIMTVVFKK